MEGKLIKLLCSDENGWDAKGRKNNHLQQKRGKVKGRERKKRKRRKVKTSTLICYLEEMKEKGGK